jgi:hypothetical protein
MGITASNSVPTSPASRAVRATIVLLVLLNLVKALTFIGAGQPTPESDGVNYWKMGIDFAHGDWLLREHAVAHRPPALPAYLAAMQTCFGRYAVVATTVLQILMDFGTGLVTAWICARVTGNRGGAVVGLALSFLCVSRSCFMIFVLADNLLCASLVLYFAAFVAWLKRPSLWTAAAIGLLLAVSALLKPIALPLWIPTLAIMAYKLWQTTALKVFWRHAAVLLIAMCILLAPWYYRNKVLFDHWFFTQFTGRAVWSGCHGRPEQMPVEDSKGPKNQVILAELKGMNVNMSAEWDVYRGLMKKPGRSDYEADKLMEAAQLEAILEHPGQYLAGRPLRFAWFWLSPKPWLDVPWGWFYRDRELPTGWPTKFKDPPESYVPPGQVRWSEPFLLSANTAYLRVVWHPNSAVFGLFALAASIGCVLMVRDPAYRDVGLVIASVLLGISLGTSLTVWPQYRYRLPLEPFMIVAITPAVLSICRRIQARIA